VVSREVKATLVLWDLGEQEDPQVSTVPLVKQDVLETMVSAESLVPSVRRETKVSKDCLVYQE